MTLQVSRSVWSQTLDIFRTCGAGRNECVAYWVGPAATLGRVDDVVHPRHSASPMHYELDDTWLTQFWVALARSNRSVRAQVHTHGGQAFHSYTDDHWPLIHTAGFLSLVVPDFAMEDLHLDDTYLVELRPEGGWRRLPPSEELDITR